MLTIKLFLYSFVVRTSDEVMKRCPWRKTFTELKNIICNDDVHLNTTCWCYACKKECYRGPRQVDGVDLDLGIFGSPCVETWFSIGYGSDGYVFWSSFCMKRIFGALVWGLELLGSMSWCRRTECRTISHHVPSPTAIANICITIDLFFINTLC